MSGFLEFYFLRMVYVALVVAGIAVLGGTAFVVLKRSGKLGAAKKVAGPAPRAALRDRSDGRPGLSRSVARTVLDRIDDRTADERDRRR